MTDQRKKHHNERKSVKGVTYRFVKVNTAKVKILER